MSKYNNSTSLFHKETIKFQKKLINSFLEQYTAEERASNKLGISRTTLRRIRQYSSGNSEVI